MSFIANPFVVVFDANVLYPFRWRDILLTFAYEGLCRARWTDQIIDEFVERLIENKPTLKDSILSQKTKIQEDFDECYVCGYSSLIDSLELPDPKDRHVLAAAIKCSAQLIVTENIRDFPPDILDEYGIEAIGADDFLMGTFELFPSECLRALRTVRERYKKPSMTRSDFVMDLTRSGLPKLAAAIRRDMEFL